MLAFLVLGMLSQLSLVSDAVELFDANETTTLARTTSELIGDPITTAEGSTISPTTVVLSTVLDFFITTTPAFVSTMAPTTTVPTTFPTTTVAPTTRIPTTVAPTTIVATTVGRTTHVQTTPVMTTATTVVTTSKCVSCDEQEDGGISNKCLSCICEVEGCAKNIGKCRQDVGSLSCGPYQIKYPYWVECGKPGGNYKRCTKQMACSETCVRAYMKRYATRCTRGRKPTCQDYARIHNGGPKGCRKQSTIGYWKKVKGCCEKPC